jgi:hypothetical protein
VPEHSGSAIGSAVLAASAPGRLAATAASMVRIRRRFEPDPARADELTDGYLRLVAALRDRGWLESNLQVQERGVPEPAGQERGVPELSGGAP